MANKNYNGLASTLAAFDRIKRAPREAVIPALLKSANELASAQKLLAETSRDTGALIDSIAVTMPGHSTPAYSQPGGSRVAGETEVIVSAGNSDVRYAHLVEYGTAEADAQPFFWTAFRLLRNRAQNRINRAAKKAVKDAWNK
ncbi:HK97-gp10 family putative phage morphogenesis protein [Agrobacterium rosae]|uniref:HK97 gp10 family phage protein n=1 Tax=Agrobacterium rosae TaxID=1972867 RepID=A0AAW9F412_9HYPH|nr:HK97-gp10 family putative phage morphogenesis protein [Agrobacterium rosae]MDX8301217.1 HK97 gp10 family phage protein [Agrobacterium rosae]